MRRGLRAALCLAVVFATGGTAFAQRTTGTLVGTVTDETGAVLPGVTVVLRGEAIMGTQTTSPTRGVLPVRGPASRHLSR